MWNALLLSSMLKEVCEKKGSGKRDRGQRETTMYKP
jgi:hypothetical protein